MQCTKNVYRAHGAWSGSPCTNKAREGTELCGVHSLNTVAKREKKSKEHYDAETAKFLAPRRKIEQQAETISHLRGILRDVVTMIEGAVVTDATNYSQTIAIARNALETN